MKYLYARHIYGWNAEQLSYYISFMGGSRAMFLLFLLPSALYHDCSSFYVLNCYVYSSAHLFLQAEAVSQRSERKRKNTRFE